MESQRRSFIKSTTALGIATTLGMHVPRARAAEFTFKFGGDLPASHPSMVYSQKAADRIRDQTGGRVDIKVFPNNQLGSDTDMLSQLRAGALEILMLSGTVLSTYVPIAAIDGVGFAFKSLDDVWKAMDGNLGAYIRAQIAKSNLVVMDRIWDHGFRQVTTSTHSVNTPADLHGLKIRMPVTQLSTSMFAALGASPSSINFSETYTALQTKIVDAEENPLAVIEVAKLYEVQKYLSLTNHIWGGNWILFNRNAFGRLPADLQAVVKRVMNETALEQRVAIAKLNASEVQLLGQKGMVVNQVDTAPFRAALTKSGFYRQWQAKFGTPAWALVEEVAGKLA